MRFLLRLFGVLFVFALVGGVGAYLWGQDQLAPTGAPATTIEIKRGTSTAEVANELERKGLVRSADVFRLVLRYTGSDTAIGEGLYDLSGKLGAFDLARALERPGRVRVVKVNIPEGLRLGEVAQRFSAAGFGSQAELLAAFRDVGRLPYTKEAANLEGFLFPATYELLPDASPAQLTGTLTRRLRQEVTAERVRRAEALGLSVYQWVTLASLVQAEAGSLAQMAPIAGVFLNRLEIDMPLQSDPTIAYGLNKPLPELDRPGGDFTRDTPYNSYTRRGLPPGPINNPGAAALAAVLAPERQSPSGQKWLYFLHGREGEFRINADFASHLRDNEQYR